MNLADALAWGSIRKGMQGTALIIMLLLKLWQQVFNSCS